MRHRVYIVDELQQNPYGQDCALIRFAHFIHCQIVASGNIRDLMIALQIAQDLRGCVRGLVPQQADHLCFRQRSIL